MLSLVAVYLANLPSGLSYPLVSTRVQLPYNYISCTYRHAQRDGSTINILIRQRMISMKMLSSRAVYSCAYRQADGRLGDVLTQLLPSSEGEPSGIHLALLLPYGSCILPDLSSGVIDDPPASPL